MTSSFGRKLDFVDQSNDLVLTTLGLMSVLDQLAKGAEIPAQDAGAVQPDDDELLVSALLGLLSVRRTVRLWIEPILSDTTPDQTVDRTAANPPAQDLMR